MLATVAATDSAKIQKKSTAFLYIANRNQTLCTLYINRCVNCVFYSTTCALRWEDPLLYFTIISKLNDYKNGIPIYFRKNPMLHVSRAMPYFFSGDMNIICALLWKGLFFCILLLIFKLLIFQYWTMTFLSAFIWTHFSTFHFLFLQGFSVCVNSAIHVHHFCTDDFCCFSDIR